MSDSGVRLNLEGSSKESNTHWNILYPHPRFVGKTIDTFHCKIGKFVSYFGCSQ